MRTTQASTTVVNTGKQGRFAFYLRGFNSLLNISPPPRPTRQFSAPKSDVHSLASDWKRVGLYIKAQMYKIESQL